jgi:hypothetical protein
MSIQKLFLHLNYIYTYIHTSTSANRSSSQQLHTSAAPALPIPIPIPFLISSFPLFFTPFILFLGRALPALVLVFVWPAFLAP